MAGPRNRAPVRVLIVDDETDLVMALKHGLESHGLVVDAFVSPFDALQKASPGYNVAIFDIRMPGMNGFELARAFRKIDPGAGIFFMTAFEINQKEFKMIFPDSGEIAGFLRKPFTTSNLVEEIDKYLEKGSTQTGE